MKREELRDLGVEDDKVDKIMAIYGRDVEGYKTQISTAKNDVAAKEKALNDLKAAGDPETLQQKITSLEEQIAGLGTKRRDDYIRLKIADKYHDPDLVLAQIVKDNADKLELGDDGIKGLDDILTEFDKSKPYMVKPTEPETPAGSGPFFSTSVQGQKEPATSPHAAANAALRSAIIGTEE